MKITQVVNSLECGGQEKMLISLAAQLKAKGHSSQIIGIAHRGELASQAEEIGIKVGSIDQKQGFSLIALWRLYRLLRAERPDILHLHNSRALVYGSMAAKLLKIPCVFTRHGSGRLTAPGWIWGSVKRIVAISNQAKGDLLKQNPCLKTANVSVIFNGVNIKDYEAVVKSAKHGDSPLTVGHVARLSPEKDQATLLKSFAQVVSRFEKNRIRLIIAGDGTARSTLEKLSYDLGISAQVGFLGYREDIPAIMNSFDVFVLSSLTEGISLTLLEAMAASKPIVATKVGGNPEVVIDGETGFLVPPQDPQAMVEKILMLLNDPALARQMGMAGRKRVEERFSLERMAGEYERVYREVISR